MNSGSSAFISSHGQSVRDALGGFVVIDVAALLHVDVAAGAPHDDHALDPARLVAGDVGVGLERNLAAAADAFVGRDDERGLAVRDAAGERVGREAAEHHRMDGADTRAGEHGVGRLGNHRQVDGDAVALLDALGLQHIGEAAHLGVQLPVGDLLVVLGIVAFPDDGDLIAALLQVAVDAVVGAVGGAVLEPLDRDVVRRERGVLHLGEGLEPVNALGVLGPEAVRVLHRARVHLLVLGLVDVGALLPFRRNVVDLLGHRNPPNAFAGLLPSLSLAIDYARWP